DTRGQTCELDALLRHGAGGEATRVGAEEGLQQRDHHPSECDGGDESCEVRIRPVAQRAERDPLDEQTEHRTEEEDQDQHDADRQVIGLGEPDPHERRSGERGRVGQVQSVEDAEHQREADGEQSIDRTEEQAVEQLLHWGAPSGPEGHCITVKAPPETICTTAGCSASRSALMVTEPSGVARSETSVRPCWMSVRSPEQPLRTAWSTMI